MSSNGGQTHDGAGDDGDDDGSLICVVLVWFGIEVECLDSGWLFPNGGLAIPGTGGREK